MAVFSSLQSWSLQSSCWRETRGGCKPCAWARCWAANDGIGGVCRVFTFATGAVEAFEAERLRPGQNLAAAPGFRFVAGGDAPELLHVDVHPFTGPSSLMAANRSRSGGRGGRAGSGRGDAAPGRWWRRPRRGGWPGDRGRASPSGAGGRSCFELGSGAHGRAPRPAARLGGRRGVTRARVRATRAATNATSLAVHHQPFVPRQSGHASSSSMTARHCSAASASGT